MRHHRAKRKLHRVKRQRVALLRSLARSLVLKESITTTVAKAKELRPYVEKLISSAKGGAAARRATSAQLGGAPDVVKRLHDTLGPRYADRKGGYTRIVRLGRVGKRMIESARIELVK